MFQFSNNSNFFWHDKSFQLLWDYKDCLFVVVHYKNSQKKSWYKSTERNYRFQRFFIKNNVGKFSNIANIDSPKVVLYLFYWYIFFPRKIIVPMNVKKLDLIDLKPIMHANEFNIDMSEPALLASSYLTPTFSMNPPTHKLSIRTKGFELNANFSQSLENSFKVHSQKNQQS